MLLRRVIEHVRTQNWFAVLLDFVIVVVGVFLGIQIGNWNEERVFDNQEEMLLVDLRSEIVESMERSGGYWKSYLEQVSEAGARSLAFINSGQPCADDCWDRIIDFFHASQFISLELDRAVLPEFPVPEGETTASHASVIVSTLPTKTESRHRRHRMPRMTGGQIIVKSLRNQGIDVLFGLPGVQLDHFFNALHDERNAINKADAQERGNRR